MASTAVFHDFGSFAKAFEADMRRNDKRMVGACTKAIQRTAAHLRRHIPVAFGELRDHVREEGARLWVDAPHAAAVEFGSRPHWMPLEPLLKWVKLRGFQGLASASARKRLPGTTTMGHAENIAEQLANQRRGGPIGPERSSTALSGVIDIARGIQVAIAVKGTKPQHYMAKAEPFALKFLGIEIKKALREAAQQ
jgi:hypothetical protein